jgi:predicted CXXCH cytochrome family protein
MRSKLVPLTAAAAGALALLMVTVARADKTDVIDSAHDLGSTGSPTCMQCHIPHEAQGMYLWSRDPAGGVGLMALCSSCHDGSVTSVGQWIPDHENHPVSAGQRNQDCDLCHDPHEGDNWNFATDALESSFRNANLCSNTGCHDSKSGDDDHPVDVLTNLPIDRTWNPDAAPPDFSGARLWNETGDQEVPSGSAHMKCATCHVPHGGALNTKLNTMSVSDPQGKHAPICENCHQ